MNLQVEQMHPLVLNVGLAIHNADWNWKNVKQPIYTFILHHRRDSPNRITRWNTHFISPPYVFYPFIYSTHQYLQFTF